MGSSTWSRWLGSGRSLGLSTSTSFAVVQERPVGHRRSRGDEGEIELSLQPLTDDLHVQQPEEPAPEPEAEGPGRFRLVGEAGVVEPELLQGVAQIGQFVAVDGEQSAEHHRLGVPVSGQSGLRRTTGGGHRLTGARPTHVLDSGDQVSHLTGPELVHRFGHRGADADLLDLVIAPGLHEPQPVGCHQRALHHPDGADHAAVLVVGRVEDQRLQRSVGISSRGGDPLDDGVQQLGHPLSGLGRDVQDRR